VGLTNSYDTFGNVAGHAPCGAHVLRELTAVTETGTNLDKIWARQAIDALLALKGGTRAAARPSQDHGEPIQPHVRAAYGD
jgi:hypothetical protein